MGKLDATWTSDTISGSVSSSVMSQDAAELYIHVPTFATTVAVHSAAYAGWRNGRSGDAIDVSLSDRETQNLTSADRVVPAMGMSAGRR